MDKNMDSFLHIFTNICKKPYEFLSVQEETAETIKDLTKDLYDFTKINEKRIYKNTLPNLIVHKFDDEQIWQELELQNENCAKDFVQTASQLCVKKEKLNFPLKLKSVKSDSAEDKSSSYKTTQQAVDEPENVDNLDSDENDADGGNEDEDSISDDNVSEGESDTNDKKRKLKPSVVDDKFFKLSELELFLQNEEKNENKSEKGSLDLFGNIDREAADYKYSDFFENPEDEPYTKTINRKTNGEEFYEGVHAEENSENEGDGDSETNLKEDDIDDVEDNEDVEDDEDVEEDKNVDKEKTKKGEKEKKKKVRFDLLNSSEGSLSDEEIEKESNDLFGSKKKMENQNKRVKSSLEERQERLGRVIEKLEDEAMSEKPWQLKGEITATTRPQNSLLEEAVDFDLSVRPAPVITEEVTMRLEDIILQRIKDKAWDDVERKVKPVETPSEFKKKMVLDQEKSKLSLAEVYEKEFIKQREAATTDDTERQEAEPALHVEVRSMLHSLFNKLDALSNYHYTPRPVAPELKVVSNVAAINMEEVAPIAVAESTLLAPQEIKGKKRRIELMSKEERSETDKKRARRLKKTRQRQRQREKERVAKEVAKINPGLGNKYSKQRAEKSVLETSKNITKMDESKDKSIKSSTSFFNKLQDEVKSQIKSRTSFTKKKDKHSVTAKKLKL